MCKYFDLLASCLNWEIFALCCFIQHFQFHQCIWTYLLLVNLSYHHYFSSSDVIIYFWKIKVLSQNWIIIAHHGWFYDYDKLKMLDKPNIPNSLVLNITNGSSGSLINFTWSQNAHVCDHAIPAWLSVNFVFFSRTVFHFDAFW